MAAIWQGKHNKSDLKKLKIFFFNMVLILQTLKKYLEQVLHIE